MAQTVPATTDLPKLDADQTPQTISGGHLVAKALKKLAESPELAALREAA